jgi:hypothetical protein
MADSSSSKKSSKASTLGFVEVAEIRDGVIMLREGQMRSVLAISSANFALKSIEEQNSIIGAYQQVLNSLEFPIQILVQSRKLNLDPYIEKLQQLEDQQENDLLRVKMQEYIEYIKEMLNQINIMKKRLLCSSWTRSKKFDCRFVWFSLKSFKPYQDHQTKTRGFYS